MTRKFTPRLEIFTQRIAENTHAIVQLCHAHGITAACGAKVACAHPAIIRALEAGGTDILTDSRLENLESIRTSGTKLPLMLLRIPTPSRVHDVVRLADITLVSDPETVRKLSDVAVKLHLKKKVILMVDMGDLREGIWPDRVVDVLRVMIEFPGLEVIGLGCNLACFGGVIPTTEKMQQLIDIRDNAELVLGIRLPVLCGGNSANLPLLLDEKMPAPINMLRIGETILLGVNVLDRSPFPGTRQDTFRLVAEIIELEEKPSIPIGLRGQDAFGGVPEFTDRGIRKRAICNIGRQDVVIENLIPEDPGIIVLGGSSDHLLLDVQDASRTLATGDEVAFSPGYSALLAANTSKYVEKVVIEGL